jgi:hypothetical protein
MNPHDEVTSVGGRQLPKEFPRSGIRPQRFGDVGRQVRDYWSWRVGVVRWRGRETGRREQAGRLEFHPPFPIDVRPLARPLSRRNFESISVVIETFDKTVNPSEAKRLTNGVFVGHRLDPCMGLVELDPDSWTRRVMLCQPRPPLSTTRNLQGHELCRHAEWRPVCAFWTDKMALPNAATTRFTVVSGSAGSVVASSRADDQRVLLRASKLLHHVLACQRLPHRPERFLIHKPHRTPARGVLRATAAVVRPFARTRVSRIAGVQRAVCAMDDVDEVHAPIVADPANDRSIDVGDRGARAYLTRIVALLEYPDAPTPLNDWTR